MAKSWDKLDFSTQKDYKKMRKKATELASSVYYVTEFSSAAEINGKATLGSASSSTTENEMYEDIFGAVPAKTLRKCMENDLSNFKPYMGIMNKKYEEADNDEEKKEIQGNIDWLKDHNDFIGGIKKSVEFTLKRNIAAKESADARHQKGVLIKAKLEKIALLKKMGENYKALLSEVKKGKKTADEAKKEMKKFAHKIIGESTYFKDKREKWTDELMAKKYKFK
ncbi:MAG: hypothetical protein LBR79_01710 [Oscillospiraceae bacterium]|jgi:hypothetical protein|nr:hypothetical protein [Oscillospiraceae bacterium]